MTAQNIMDRRSVLQKLVDVAQGITVLVRTPAIKKSATQQSTAVTEAEALAGKSMASKIGLNNNGFLASNDDGGTYQDAVEKQFAVDDAVVCAIILFRLILQLFNFA